MNSYSVLQQVIEDIFKVFHSNNYCNTNNHRLRITQVEAEKQIIEPYLSLYKEVDLEDVALFCSTLILNHHDFTYLAGAFLAQHIHNTTADTFLVATQQLASGHLLDDWYLERVQLTAKKIDYMIKHDNDFTYDYFALQSLYQSYLLRDPTHGHVIERPQYMLARIATSLYDPIQDPEDWNLTYCGLTNKLYSHATPTIFHAGTKINQLASCFLYNFNTNIERPQCDQIAANCETFATTLTIASQSGGIGLGLTDLPAAFTTPASRQTVFGRTNQKKYPKLFDVLRHIEADLVLGSVVSKRISNVAGYLEPWHPDIYEFASISKTRYNTEGSNVMSADHSRFTRIFPAIWIPDLFMQRVRDNESWSLMCPILCKDLTHVYGRAFNQKFERYEALNSPYVVRKIKARHLWDHILAAKIETGVPYLMFKDACNFKSNQKHMGIIRNSNLCAEIVQFSSGVDDVAVCNLASLALPNFVVLATNSVTNEPVRYFCFDKLANTVRRVCRNLNVVIDRTRYPVEGAKNSNLRSRPIGIGVMGFADVCHRLKIVFDGEEARQLNKEIFETIYFHALTESCAIAQQKGAPYDGFFESPAANGFLQMDLMWQHEQDQQLLYLAKENNHVNYNSGWKKYCSKRLAYDWDALKNHIKKYGLMNSLLTAVMPTASTSQLLGMCESIEPYYANVYARNVTAGSFTCINPHLVAELFDAKIFNSQQIEQLLRNYGSAKNFDTLIPNSGNFTKRFRTMQEIDQKSLIQMSIDRAPFVDQSQSLNLHLVKPTLDDVSELMFMAWEGGLKTGMYYLRTNPAMNPLSFGGTCQSCT